MKTIITVFLTLLYSTSSFCAHWYGNVNLGTNAVSTYKTLTYPLGNNALTQAKFASSYQNFHAQFSVGRIFFNHSRWSSALEADVDIFTGRATYQIKNWFLANPAYGQEHFNTGLGVFILPAYELQKGVQLFLGLGVSVTPFSMSSDGYTGGNIGTTGNQTRWLTGGGFKAGSALTWSPKYTLLLTYQFTAYQTTERTVVEPFSNNLLQARYQPFVNLIMLGLQVHLDSPV